MRLVRTLYASVFTAVVGAMAFCAQAQTRAMPRNYAGFDANEYPGDDQLAALHQQFAFTGYWLNNPPGANHNPWAGKRDVLMHVGLGFLVAFNGRLDKELLTAQKAGTQSAAMARQDAGQAVAAARREGFPAGTIIFLDQEEGGRMLPEQAAYLLGWTEAVASSGYKPGVYGSGMPVPDGDQNGRKTTITTIQDIREHVAAEHLHPIAFWVYQDTCPPAPGCVVEPAKRPALDASGILNVDVWQFAQSPRRPEARACMATYNRDGNCYLPDASPAMAHYQLDLSVSSSPDPSHGR